MVTIKHKNVRQELLEALKHSLETGEYISGETLSGKLHISRAAVWKHIRNLRKDEYKIESVTNRGYRLISAPDLLLPDELIAGLKTKLVGREIKYYSEISSTNEEGRRSAELGASDGTVIIAETQIRGRGRRGRAWASPLGGVWLSIILRPNIPPEHAPILTLLTGVAVARTIKLATNLTATLKWPNDVLINGNKVCGILTEISAEPDMINYVVIGLGINANITADKFPKDIRDLVTSLELELEHKVDRVKFTQLLFEEFEKYYLEFCSHDRQIIPEVLDGWRQLTDTLGREVKIETINGAIIGRATDIAEDGALLVLAENGMIRRIIAGDCIYLNI